MVPVKLLAVCAALFISTALPAYADEDIDYQGEVDIYTGEPAETEDEDGEPERETVKLADGSIFNFEENTFTYLVPGDNAYSVVSSVPDKTITTDEVSISYSDGVTAALYLDGEIVEEPDFSEISDSGNYSVIVSGVDAEYQMLSFTIVPEKTGMISSYLLPEGFELIEVTLDDEVQTLSDKKIAKMKKDGSYTISYRCKATGLEYGLKVEIDHTPPDIKLEGVKNGIAKNPVTVKGIDRDDEVSLTKNGEKYRLSKDGTLKMPGEYVLEVTDDAGNTVTKKFEIKFYLDRQGLLFGLLALAVIIWAIVYMVMARKKLRVR